MLIEAYAAGPEAMAPIEAAMEGFEWLTGRPRSAPRSAPACRPR